MKQKFSHSWISSRQPRKQRKYQHNAPLNILHNLLSAHLSKELRKKYSIRNIQLRKGDSIKICRGQFKKRLGKIERILLKKHKVHVSGIEHAKKSGEKSFYPIHPSNLVITELNLDDKRRVEKLNKRKLTASKEKAKGDKK